MPNIQSEGLRKLHVWITNWYPVVAVLFYAIILGVGYLMFIKPKLGNVIDIQRKQLNVLVENKDATEYGKELESFIKKSDQFTQQNSESLKRLSTFMPEQPTIPQLFTLFEYFFKDNGFIVKKLDFTIRDTFDSKPVELGEKNGSVVILPSLGSTVGVIDISASVSGGGYVDFKNMLLKMEKIGRLVDLNNLNITASDGGDNKTDYTLQMRTYYYKGN